jgi:hypothetical protein
MLKSLQSIARDPDAPVDYWRVIKKNGDLIAALPGGVDNQAKRLTEAGFELDRFRNTPQVSEFRCEAVPGRLSCPRPMNWSRRG